MINRIVEFNSTIEPTNSSVKNYPEQMTCYGFIKNAVRMTFKRQNLRLILADIQLARSTLNKFYLVLEDKDLTNRYSVHVKRNFETKRCKKKNKIPSGIHQMEIRSLSCQNNKCVMFMHEVILFDKKSCNGSNNYVHCCVG